MLGRHFVGLMRLFDCNRVAVSWGFEDKVLRGMVEAGILRKRMILLMERIHT